MQPCSFVILFVISRIAIQADAMDWALACVLCYRFTNCLSLSVQTSSFSPKHPKHLHSETDRLDFYFDRTQFVMASIFVATPLQLNPALTGITRLWVDYRDPESPTIGPLPLANAAPAATVMCPCT